MVEIFLHKGKVSWKEWALRLIQIGTDSEYFHVGVAWKNEPLIVESTSKRGVDIRPIQHYYELIEKKGREIEVYECVANINENGFYGWLLEQVDKKYDTWGIIGLGLTKIFRTRDAANKLASEHDFWCSELAIRGLRKFAINDDAFDDMRNNSIVAPAGIIRSRWFQYRRTL